MSTAFLVAAELAHMPPVTNLYKTDDDTHLLVTVVSVPDFNSIITDVGQMVPISRSHIVAEVAVFHSDERGAPIDADGDPLNGMTPWASTNHETDAELTLPRTVTTHEEALAELGYALTEQELTDG